MIRSLRPSDLNQVYELDKVALKSNWSLKDYDLELRNPDSICLCIELDGKIHGYAIVRRTFSDSELLQILITPLYQKKSYGQKLLLALMDDLIQLGTHSLFLEVAENNASAYHLYKKLGFSLIRKRDHYYGKDNHGLVMRKELLA